MATNNPYQPPYGANTYLLANQLMQMSQDQYPSPQNRLAPWSNLDGDPGNDYGAEKLPPWDNDPSLLPPQLTWEQRIGASRPADFNVDRGCR